MTKDATKDATQGATQGAATEGAATEDGSKKPFIVRGSHSVISACTLPPWASPSVVDSMVETFGAMLRQDLVTLMDNMATSGFNRNRSHSTGSDTLSVDSSDSYVQEPQDVGRSFRMKAVQRRPMN